jgi:hypothetical protein
MKTKKWIFFLAGISLVLMMAGCPYESNVPLNDSCSAALDPQLTGRWIFPKTSHSNDTIEILPFNAHEYLVISANEGKGMAGKDALGRAFISVVDGVKYLNFYDIRNNGKCIFFKYEIDAGKLTTSSPSDSFIKRSFRSSGELSLYFKKNHHQEGFFEPADTAYLIPEQKK